jgi:ABC-2 type transport system permease protein
MSTPADVIHGSTPEVPAKTVSQWQSFYWCVARELWEYRSIYVAPLAVGVAIVIGFLFGTIAGLVGATSRLDPAQSPERLVDMYLFVAGLSMVLTFIISVYYCLDTLQSERRDRSILFWKSLPVSDLTVVLAKASIPIVVIPLITFAITVGTHIVMFLITSIAFLARGQSVAEMWSQLSLFSVWGKLFYHLLTGHGIWYAPIYAWFLFASAWSRRAVLLWALLPPFAIGIVERLIFGSNHFGQLLMTRMLGGPGDFGLTRPQGSMSSMMHVDPMRFISSPGLWIGLAATALFLWGTARLRRERDPN